MVRIRRLHARYHLPSSRGSERARLDRILRVVLDEALERALERAGVTPHEEICIRRLSVALRLRLSLSDSALALAWSASLAESITRARNGAYVPDVVCYNSAAHALFDMVVGVATGRFERAWAWRLAGVWRDSESPSTGEATAGLIFALMEEPARIAPLMGAVAERHVAPAVFAGLSRRISAAQWSELARAALHASGIPVSILDNAAAPGIAEVVRQAQRMLRTSPLAHAVMTQQLPMDAIEIRRAFAAFIALDQDPAALRGSPRGRSLVSALSDAMHPAALRPSTGPPPKGPSKEPRMSPDEDRPSAITRRALTNFGGLLFLLRTIEALNLPQEMLARCPRRPFRWILHQLALALVPVEPDEPAALAFAGLLPNGVPPSQDDAPPTDEEREMIAGFVERIDAVLEDHIEEQPPIAFVCQRAAEIVADPGWIEVRFSLNDVSTAIRRAGLDLDPGWLPWLGVVVRFVYE